MVAGWLKPVIPADQDTIGFMTPISSGELCVKKAVVSLLYEVREFSDVETYTAQCHQVAVYFTFPMVSVNAECACQIRTHL